MAALQIRSYCRKDLWTPGVKVQDGSNQYAPNPTEDHDHDPVIPSGCPGDDQVNSYAEDERRVDPPQLHSDYDRHLCASAIFLSGLPLEE
jgi:hypothetical protein